MNAFVYLGGILAIVGGIWLLVVAFQKSVWWGLGSLLVPFVSLVFVILNWQESKKPFLIQLAGVVLGSVGVWQYLRSAEMAAAAAG